jgi:predicted dehydrogenase
VQALQNALLEGRLGKLVLGASRMRWCRQQPYYSGAKWRGTWAMDGGVFANQAYHQLDLLLWLLGDVESVFAYSARQLADIEAEDTGVAVLRFAGGVLAVAEATTATRPVDLQGSISVLGEHGSVEIGGFAMNHLDLWKFNEPDPRDEVIMREQRCNPPDDRAFAHALFMEAALRCIREDLPPVVGAEDGLACLSLIHALYESIETGQEVRLADFEPRFSPLGRAAMDRLVLPPRLRSPVVPHVDPARWRHNGASRETPSPSGRDRIRLNEEEMA